MKVKRTAYWQSFWVGGVALHSSQKPELAPLLVTLTDCGVILSPAVPPSLLLGISTAGIVSHSSIDYPQNLLLLLTIMGKKNHASELFRMKIYAEEIDKAHLILKTN